jgi:hypothetical protein
MHQNSCRVPITNVPTVTNTDLHCIPREYFTNRSSKNMQNKRVQHYHLACFHCSHWQPIVVMSVHRIEEVVSRPPDASGLLHSCRPHTELVFCSHTSAQRPCVTVFLYQDAAPSSMSSPLAWPTQFTLSSLPCSGRHPQSQPHQP